MLTVSQVEVLSGSLAGTAETDVTIVGGGTAGFVAAIAAAREGARVVLIESLNGLAGTHAAGGLVKGATGFYHTYLGDSRFERNRELELLVRGIAFEYFERLRSAGGAYSSQEGRPPINMMNDVEISQVVAEEMATDAGVDIWFESQFVDAVVDQAVVNAVLVTRGGGLWRLATKVLIDASGDGIAAAQAGAPFSIGRDSDEKPQPATMFFEVSDVNIRETLAHLAGHPEDFDDISYGFPPSAEYLLNALDAGRPFNLKVMCGYRTAQENGELPRLPGRDATIRNIGSIHMHWRNGRLVPSVASINIEMVYGLDPRDRDLRDDMTVLSKRFILELAEYYRRYVPGFADCWVSRFPAMIGAREGRRITGDYMITAEDAFGGVIFDDAIGRCGAFLDVHAEEIGEPRPLDFREVGGERGWFHVPYRSLIASEVSGVLLAGRLVSSDHLANGSVRNQIICMMTGQAAGVAAALAALSNVSPREVGIRDLQQRLRAQNAII